MKKIFLICILMSSLAFSQNDSLVINDRTGWQTFTYDMGNVLGGVGYAYSRPLYWKGPQLRNFGLFVGGAGALYVIDDNVRPFFADLEGDVPKPVREFGWYFGNPQNNYAFTGSVYLVGLVTKNEKLRRTGVLMMSAATAAGLLQQVTKTLVGRARPTTELGKNHFQPFGGESGLRSFPSGHTVMGLTIGYAAAKQFKNPWVKAGFITVGAIPGLSRLLNEQHWLSDVAVGAVMSIFIVESVDRYLDRKYDEKYNNDTKKLSWNLNFAPNQIGVNITF